MSTVLKAVKLSGDKNKIYTLTLVRDAEERKYLTDEGTYLKIGSPLSGFLFDKQSLAAVRACDEKIRCLRRAIRALEASDKSERALRMKLRAAGFSADATDGAIERCKEYGYLDERRVLLATVERLANRELIGKYKIMARLASRGYGISAIKDAILSLTDDGTVDFSENEAVLLEKHGASAGDEMATKLLYKYGYRK